VFDEIVTHQISIDNINAGLRLDDSGDTGRIAVLPAYKGDLWNM